MWRVYTEVVVEAQGGLMPQAEIAYASSEAEARRLFRQRVRELLEQGYEVSREVWVDAEGAEEWVGLVDGPYRAALVVLFPPGDPQGVDPQGVDP